MVRGDAPQVSRGRPVAEGLDRAATLDDLARTVVASALELPTVVRVGLALTLAAGRELAFVSSDPGAISPAPVGWCRIDGLADVPLAQAVRTRLPVQLPDVAALARRYPHMVERQVSLGTRALAAYPLLSGGTPVGGLLLSFDRAQPFDDEQHAILTQLAARAAAATRRIRDRERRAAERGHARGPEHLPAADGLEVGHHHRLAGGAEDGGHWVELLDLAEGSVLLSVGRAGAAVVRVRAAVREAAAAVPPDPASVLQRLDGLAAEVTPGRSPSWEAAVAVVDPARRRLQVATAGAAAILLARPGVLPQLARGVTGPPLGHAAGPRVTTTLELEPGVLVLLASAVSSPVAQDALVRVVRDLAPDGRDPLELCLLLDDERAAGAVPGATLLAARVLAGTDVRTSALQLPPSTEAPRTARRFVGEHLSRWNVGQLGEAAQGCVSELVTNAVIHSAAPSRLSLRLDRHRLLVTVRDRGGAGEVSRGALAADEVGGRGLSLVEAFSSAWGSRRGADGTTVWFELSVGP